MICLTGTFAITGAEETRTFGPGDILLAVDIDGTRHATFTGDGYTVAVVPL